MKVEITNNNGERNFKITVNSDGDCFYLFPQEAKELLKLLSEKLPPN